MPLTTMTNFQLFLAWALILSGLVFSGMLVFYGVRKYRNETTHSFSARDFMFGKNRHQKPSLQLFLEAALGLLAVALLYFMLIAGKK